MRQIRERVRIPGNRNSLGFMEFGCTGLSKATVSRCARETVSRAKSMLAKHYRAVSPFALRLSRDLAQIQLARRSCDIRVSLILVGGRAGARVRFIFFLTRARTFRAREQLCRSRRRARTKDGLEIRVARVELPVARVLRRVGSPDDVCRFASNIVTERGARRRIERERGGGGGGGGGGGEEEKKRGKSYTLYRLLYVPERKRVQARTLRHRGALPTSEVATLNPCADAPRRQRRQGRGRPGMPRAA